MAKFWLENGKVCSDEDLSVFDEYQMEEIRLGLEHGVDVSIYAKSEFNYEQMEQIRLGLEHGVDASIYAKSKINDCQMSQVRAGLEEGIDISAYVDPQFVDSFEVRNWLMSFSNEESLLEQLYQFWIKDDNSFASEMWSGICYRVEHFCKTMRGFQEVL